MLIKITHVLASLIMLIPLSSFSYQLPVADNTTYSMNKLSINVAAGYLSGESNEYVYGEDDTKLSQLNWKMKGAAVIKGEMNVDFRPWLTANVNGWTTVTHSNAQMDDYDWLVPGQTHWSEWSHHSDIDTDLNYANNIDVNMRAWFLQNQSYRLGVTAGYQQSVFDFSANGGCYQYGNGEYIGCFPTNSPGIGYQQTFNTVYLGLAGNYRVNKFEFNGVVKVGPWVNAKDTDEHYARNITFYEEGDNSTFSSLALTAGYHFNPHAKVFFEAAYSQFTNGKADSLIDDHSGELYYINNAAGLSNHNYVLALGVQYTPYST